MNLSIKYNGKDITSSVDLFSGKLTDRYGKMLDDLKLKINDKDGAWLNYGVQKCDEIIIKTDDYSTGTMYIDDFSGSNGIFSIGAVSSNPKNKVVKSRIWRHVRLTEVLNDVATTYGLTLKTYGIEDYTYESLSQIQKTDLEFVNYVCMREGYSVKVDNNCLIVFNEKYMEEQNTDLKIKADEVEEDYTFIQSSECVHSVTVSHYDTDYGLIKQTATDDSVCGGSKFINERATTFAEAKRFAYGYLRAYNKKNVIGYLSMGYNPKMSAGTVFHAEGFKSFDGKYVVIEVSHDIKREITYLTVRKTLEY